VDVQLVGQPLLALFESASDARDIEPDDALELALCHAGHSERCYLTGLQTYK